MIKTFPLVMDENFHKRLADASEKAVKPIKTFVFEAIEEKIKRVEDAEKKLNK